MEQEEQLQHEEHEVYGGEIPDDRDMDADPEFDNSARAETDYAEEFEEEEYNDHDVDDSHNNNPNKVFPNLSFCSMSVSLFPSQFAFSDRIWRI